MLQRRGGQGRERVGTEAVPRVQEPVLESGEEKVLNPGLPVVGTGRWESVPAWSPETDSLVVGLALLRHVDAHVERIQQLNPQVQNAKDTLQRTKCDLEVRVEAKHGIDDILAALDFCAYDVYERRCCAYAKKAQPHLNSDNRRQVYFPFRKRSETRDAYIKRGTSRKQVVLYRFFADMLFADRHLEGEWIRHIHEVGTQSKHQMLTLTHVGKVGYGFVGTDFSVSYALWSARKEAERILRQTRRLLRLPTELELPHTHDRP